MDPASMLILKHRLQAVVFKRNLWNDFSKIFQTTTDHSTITQTQVGSRIAGKISSDEVVEDVDLGQQSVLPNPHEEVEQTSLVQLEAEASQEAEINDEACRERTPEEEQTCREEAYIHFTPFDEVDDYSAGPCRFVLASDGVRPSAAILLTYELSQKIKEALAIQRLYASEEPQAEREMRARNRFERQVKNEIRNQELRTKHSEHEIPDPKGDADSASLQKGIEVLEAILMDLSCKKKSIETQLASRASMLREVQCEVSAYLDEAFQHASLIEPEEGINEVPFEEFDLQEEYQKKLEHKVWGTSNAGEPEEVYEMAPRQLDTTPAYLRKDIKPPTDDELSKQEILKAVWDAQDRVQQAQGMFDNKANEQAYEQQMAYEAELAGQPIAYATADDFDVHWVKRNQQITRELNEAEESYCQAKAAALEAQVRFQTDDQSSCFGDDFDCAGYPMSEEIDVEGAISWVAPKVDNWLENVPQDAESNFEGSVDVDDWDFRELDLSDSLSCVDYGRRRKRIDDWQRDCQIVQVSLP